MENGTMPQQRNNGSIQQQSNTSVQPGDLGFYDSFDNIIRMNGKCLRLSLVTKRNK